MDIVLVSSTSRSATAQPQGQARADKFRAIHVLFRASLRLEVVGNYEGADELLDSGGEYGLGAIQKVLGTDDQTDNSDDDRI